MGFVNFMMIKNRHYPLDSETILYKISTKAVKIEEINQI